MCVCVYVYVYVCVCVLVYVFVRCEVWRGEEGGRMGPTMATSLRRMRCREPQSMRLGGMACPTTLHE